MSDLMISGCKNVSVRDRVAGINCTKGNRGWERKGGIK